MKEAQEEEEEKSKCWTRKSVSGEKERYLDDRAVRTRPMNC